MAIGVHYKGTKGQGVAVCPACSGGQHQLCHDRACICRPSHNEIINFVSALGFIKQSPERREGKPEGELKK